MRVRARAEGEGEALRVGVRGEGLRGLTCQPVQLRHHVAPLIEKFVPGAALALPHGHVAIVHLLDLTLQTLLTGHSLFELSVPARLGVGVGAWGYWGWGCWGQGWNLGWG